MNSKQPPEGENSKSSSPRLKTYVAFLLEILQAIADNEANLHKVYPLLQANLDKLDDTFVEVLRDWAAITLPRVERVQALIIAAALVNLGNLGDFLQKEYRLNRADQNIPFGQQRIPV